jgi:hypothetical protein
LQQVTVFVPHEPRACWRLFTDVSLLGAWVPGLRRAQVIAKQRGMPIEVHYEFATMLAYTLVYTYDADRLEVRWQPKIGKAEGVTGFARFDAAIGGTELTYGLEHGEGRSDSDRELGDPSKLVAALQAWLIAQLAEQP